MKIASLPFPDVLHALPKKGQDMLVFHLVKDFTAVFAGPDELHLAEAAQVMRDGRFADADGLGQGGNVHFAFREYRDKAHSAGIAEDAKQLCDMGGGMLVKDSVVGSAPGADFADYRHRCYI
jgi:hypothetical protein